jgi:hypothetical protein
LIGVVATQDRSLKAACRHAGKPVDQSDRCASTWWSDFDPAHISLVFVDDKRKAERFKVKGLGPFLV